MDYFHYCNAKDSEKQGEKRKQAPCRDPPHVKIPSRNLGKSYAAEMEVGKKELPHHAEMPSQKLVEKSYAEAIELEKKEPSCRGHPRLDEAYQKFVQDSHDSMIEYVRDNPDHFCETCGLNIKYTRYLKASYQYEALILSEDDCKICESTKEENCNADKHEEYHRENCLKPLIAKKLFL
jgi:hypothetical protein